MNYPNLLDIIAKNIPTKKLMDVMDAIQNQGKDNLAGE